ncbi:MAG: protease complex subunit PrcB family protein [Bacteroidia bacterium]|nr:protease complex subunit PrcB family protein [Bacteroidia bacterium]
MTRGYLLGLCLLLSLFACKSQQSLPAAGSPIPHEVISTGSYSGISAAYDTVITDDRTWATFWQELGSNRFPAPEQPAVNFETHIVLVALMGTQSGGGYTISIAGVSSGSQGVVVEVVKTTPGPDCMTTDALTQPYCIVSIPRQDTQVSFVSRTTVTNCK